MKNNFSQIKPELGKRSKKGQRIFFSLVFALFLFIIGNTCSAYVTPDWNAIKRANERQESKIKPYYYNLKKEIKMNKKQKINFKLYKYNRKAELQRNKRQNFNKGFYKYDRKAELRRNARQKVN
jgi:hypothetical protein